MRKICIAVFLSMTVLCMAFIFWQSAKDAEASSSASAGITDSVAEIIRPENPEADRTESGEVTPQRKAFLDLVSEAVRNTAHVLEFAALAFFAYLTSLSLGADKTVRLCLLAIPCTLAFGFLYALSDEWHQTQTPGRAFEWKDIALDTLGALLGILFALLAFFLFSFFLKKHRAHRAQKAQKSP